MQFSSLCLRLFASGFVLATAFSLNAPNTGRATASAGKSIAFAGAKAGPAAVAVPAKSE
jgi:hypothetical protein